MTIQPRYAYHYAEIDPSDNMCIGILTTSVENAHLQQETLVPIASYDDAYVEKYYNWDTNKWYYDAEMTNEWIPV